MKNHLKIFFSICMTLTFLRAQPSDENSNRMKTVPGEILIKYNIHNYSNPQGEEILSEHSRLISKIEKITNESTVVPACSQLIKKMVEENSTEKSLIEQSLKKRQEKMAQLSYLKRKSATYGQVLQVPEINASRILLLRLKDKNKTEDIIDLLKYYSDDEFFIEYAEPNYIYSSYFVPNDAMYEDQWSHKKTEIEKAWDITRGNENILIAIIDSGIDLYHEDLVNNISEIMYDFVDIDTNAYKTDFSSLYADEDYVVPDSIPMDFGGHGTHVAGIVAAEGNNGIGVTGVAPGCRIMPLRAGFSINGLSNGELGYLENDDIINAMQYAILNGADIINMSFGSSSESGIMTTVINQAVSAGIILIAAAGNTYSDDKHYPAALDGVISVSATLSDDKKANFSTYGMWVDIAAPGAFILSTVPKSGGAVTSPTGYNWASGTSMAAPYVTGVTALLLSQTPGLTFSQIKNILRQSVDPISENILYMGTGRINAFKAVSFNPLCAATGEITAPTINSLVTSNIEIKGGFTGNRYSLYYGVGLYPSEWILIAEGESTTSDLLGTLDLTTLNDTTYAIKLRSEDNYGFFETRTFIRVNKVIFTSTLMEGFPIKLLDVELYYTADSKPVIYDINCDSKNEVVLIANGWVHVYNSSGIDIPGWPKNTGWTQSWMTPTIADLNNDGFYEILVVSNSSSMLENNPGALNIYDCEGNNYSEWNSSKSFNNFLRAPVVTDLDSDGNLNVILFDYTGRIYLYDNNGVLLWQKELNEELEYVRDVSAADINNDGIKEIIASTYNSWIYIFDQHGEVLNSFRVLVSWGNIVVADLNNDSVPEIVISISNSTGTEGWVAVWDLNGNQVFRTATNDFTYNIAVGDINNDSSVEIIFSCGNPQKLYVLDSEGNNLPGWPINLPDNSKSYTNILIYNIDADPQQEIIIGQRNGNILAYNDDGSKYTAVSAGGFLSAISIGDIDLDLIPELAAHCYDGKLYAWKVSDIQMERGKGEWAFYNHDIHQSGNYHYIPLRLDNYAPICKIGSTYTINEDDSLSITNFVKDADRDLITFITFYDESVFSVDVNQENLFIKPAPNWNGSDTVIVVASDGSLTDTASFLMIVKPLNDPPQVYSVSDTTVYNCDSIFINLKFSDPDNEDLLVTVASTNDTVKLAVKDSILIIKPEEGWTGSSTITIKVKDIRLSDTTSFNFIVLDTTTTSVTEYYGIPENFKLYQNFPNPFNPQTRIMFALPEVSPVKIDVYNIVGAHVKTLLNQEMPAGYHFVDFTVENEASGVYFYQIVTGKYREVKKFILMR